MKFLLVLALAGAVFADKDVMLQENRVVAATTQVGSVCDECQVMVKKFVEASHDQAKMRALKFILRTMCHETSYKEECEVFVDNIDTMIKKLEPYLSDTQRVCKSFHMCGNKKFDAFRRIGLLYVKRYQDEAEGLKDLVCDECQMAAREIKTLVDDKERQKQVRDFISQEICVHAGSYRGMCDMFVEQFLPEVFQELDTILADTKKACADLGFCASVTAPRKLDINKMASSHPILDFWKKAGTVKTSKGAEVLMSCLDCKIFYDGVLLEAEDDRNNIAKDFQNFVCGKVLPKNFTASCEDFMSMYLPTVLYMTFRQFSGEGICGKKECCNEGSIAALNAISLQEQKELAHKNCAPLEAFIAENFAGYEMRFSAVAVAHEQICDGYVPGAFRNLCYSISEAIVPKFLNTVAHFARQGDFCRA